MTISAVVGWNSKLNSIIGKQQSNLFLLVKRLKGETEFSSWQLKSKKHGQLGQFKERLMCNKKRDFKMYVEEYDESNDAYKCVKALSYINKCE
jgi:hypothetical protein